MIGNNKTSTSIHLKVYIVFYSINLNMISEKYFCIVFIGVSLTVKLDSFSFLSLRSHEIPTAASPTRPNNTVQYKPLSSKIFNISFVRELTLENEVS